MYVFNKITVAIRKKKQNNIENANKLAYLFLKNNK